jgi:hypothetical protein
MKSYGLLSVICITSAALTLSSPAANADIVTLSANLIGANEFPPVASPGTGQATVILDTTNNIMEVKISFSGLTSGTTAAHIHCCLASPFLTNVNVPVATTIPTFPGFPLGVTSGTYDQTFDLTANSTYNLINIPPAMWGIHSWASRPQRPCQCSSRLS